MYIVLAIFLLPFSLIAQDTLSVRRMHHNHTFTTVVIENDTNIYAHRADGSLESIRPIRRGMYVRYYPSGELMWKQQRKNDKAHGEMQFYAKNGTHVGTLLFHEDSIIDTIFLNPKTPFLFGRFTYNSTIHGGMRRPDGSSNVSQSEGARRHEPLYLVRQPVSKTPKKYTEFSADYNGYFFQIVEMGTYGIFPQNFDLQLVTNTMGAPPAHDGSGINSHYNIHAPIKMHTNYCYLLLHVHSIGYAP